MSVREKKRGVFQAGSGPSCPAWTVRSTTPMLYVGSRTRTILKWRIIGKRPVEIVEIVRRLSLSSYNASGVSISSQTIPLDLSD